MLNSDLLALREMRFEKATRNWWQDTQISSYLNELYRRGYSLGLLAQACKSTIPTIQKSIEEDSK